MKVQSNGRTSSGRRLVLLAATTDIVPAGFGEAGVDPAEHRRLLQSAQRLRGSVYLADGAIKQSDLTPDGRYASRLDRDCWHFLVVNEIGEVRGCLRYRPQMPSLRFEDLGISRSAMAHSPEWGGKLRLAVEAEIERANERGIQYVEVGGWAMAEELRCSTESLRLALTSYALALHGGGALGIVNATRRHSSAQILRKVGGAPLVWKGAALPHYHDPRYQCDMEILRFDSDLLSPTLSGLVDAMARKLPEVSVVIERPPLVHSLGRMWQALALAGNMPTYVREAAHAS